MIRHFSSTLAFAFLCGGCASNHNPSTNVPPPALAPAPVPTPSPQPTLAGPVTPDADRSAHTINASGLALVSNTACPIEPAHAIRKSLCLPEHTRLYKGKLIGFCCEDCPAAWDAMTDAQRDAALFAIAKR